MLKAAARAGAARAGGAASSAGVRAAAAGAAGAGAAGAARPWCCSPVLLLLVLLLLCVLVLGAAAGGARVGVGAPAAGSAETKFLRFRDQPRSRKISSKDRDKSNKQQHTRSKEKPFGFLSSIEQLCCLLSNRNRGAERRGPRPNFCDSEISQEARRPAAKTETRATSSSTQGARRNHSAFCLLLSNFAVFYLTETEEQNAEGRDQISAIPRSAKKQEDQQQRQRQEQQAAAHKEQGETIRLSVFY